MVRRFARLRHPSWSAPAATSVPSPANHLSPTGPDSWPARGMLRFGYVRESRSLKRELLGSRGPRSSPTDRPMPLVPNGAPAVLQLCDVSVVIALMRRVRSRAQPAESQIDVRRTLVYINVLPDLHPLLNWGAK